MRCIRFLLDWRFSFFMLRQLQDGYRVDSWPGFCIGARPISGCHCSNERALKSSPFFVSADSGNQVVVVLLRNSICNYMFVRWHSCAPNALWVSTSKRHLVPPFLGLIAIYKAEWELFWGKNRGGLLVLVVWVLSQISICKKLSTNRACCCYCYGQLAWLSLHQALFTF